VAIFRGRRKRLGPPLLRLRGARRRGGILSSRSGKSNDVHGKKEAGIEFEGETRGHRTVSYGLQPVL